MQSHSEMIYNSEQLGVADRREADDSTASCHLHFSLKNPTESLCICTLDEMILNDILKIVRKFSHFATSIRRKDIPPIIWHHLFKILTVIFMGISPS